MRTMLGVLSIATWLVLQVSGAFAQSSNPSGAFESFSPGNLGNGGGLQSDFQSVREDMVKKMKDGTYADIMRQARGNMEAHTLLRERQGRRR
ncbi:hypothetical protein [Microvirga sp. 2TAF3]|uniref:hypothetical protein n=1 Tax=Microvirga sp. 2TAF3 TaxID=3233014 RepID=UPI003F949362